MSGETERNVSGWTIDTLAQHVKELRLADERLEAERDRRYSEVATEREKALRIKEQADRDALGLARQIQEYKDEKANELRAQIEGERGDYLNRLEYNSAHVSLQNEVKATAEKIEESIKPLAAYVAAQSGPRAITGTTIGAVVVAVVLVLGLYVTVTRSKPTTVIVPTPATTTPSR